MERTASQIECSTASIPVKKRHWKNAQKIKPEPDTAPVSTVASGLGSSGNNDLRAKILARRAYHNSKGGADFRAKTCDEMTKERPCSGSRYVAMGKTTRVKVNSSRALSAKQFKNKSDGKNYSVTSGTRFQAGQKTLRSEYNFKKTELLVVIKSQFSLMKRHIQQIMVTFQQNM
jgi:hypothetical protein